MTAPNGCFWCGIEKPKHNQRWDKDAGWHLWVEPNDQQRLARMKARRASRKGA